MRSLVQGVAYTFVMLDPFEEGETYEIEGVVVEIKEDTRKVRIKNRQEVMWLPVDEILEIKDSDTHF